MNTQIAYVTDIHLEEQFPIDQGVDPRKNWNIIRNDISSRGVNEIILGGDIGTKSTYKWFFDSLNNYNIAISLGNHDHFNEIVKHYPVELANRQKELYFSQDRQFYKFIFLDSSSGAIGEEQFIWLKKELSTPKKIVLFIHHPILAIDAEIDKQFALQGRDRIRSVLLHSAKDVTIFCGHYHFKDTSTHRNIRQYITPAASYQVVKSPNEIKVSNDEFGYRLIALNDKEVTTRLVLFH